MTNPEPEREMPDRDDRLLDLDDHVDVYEDDREPEPEERALPPRRRRRLVTPASAARSATQAIDSTELARPRSVTGAAYLPSFE